MLKHPYLFALLYGCCIVYAFPQTSHLASLSFLVLGDWGKKGKNVQATVEDLMCGEMVPPASFVISTGDNFYKSQELDYEGVLSISDIKFRQWWRTLYDGCSHQVPWYLVLGNHDWRGSPTAQIGHKWVDPLWNEEFFYSVSFDLNQVGLQGSAVFIFIDTNLLAYGMQGESKDDQDRMKKNFQQLGWNQDTLEKQMLWIEQELQKHNHEPYLFIVGHHPVAYCEPEGQMERLKPLFEKYQVSGYFFGHQHHLGYGLYSQTPQILSGAGSKAKSSCQHTHPENNIWEQARTLGVARGVIDALGFSVEFWDNEKKMIYKSKPTRPRDTK